MAESQTSSTSISYEDRVARANQWLTAAVEIVADADIPYATEVLAYMHPDNGFSVTEPITDGLQWGLGMKTDADMPSLTPLAEQDRAMHPYFDNLYTQNHATYQETERSMYIHYEMLGGRAAGIVLLHEGFHGFAHANNLWRDIPDNWGHWYEEVKVFEFEHKILRHIGGSSYEELAQEWAPIISERISKGVGSDKELFEGISLQKLSTVLDMEITDETEGFLLAAFLLQAYFYSLDGSFELGDDITRHAHFVRWVYKSSEPSTPIPPLRQSLYH